MNGSWSREDIAGKPADVYTPPGTARPRFGVLYLRGTGVDLITEQPTFSRFFDELRLACVCPDGARAWWADRVCTAFDPAVTAEGYLLQSVVPFFAARWGLSPRGIGLLGVSVGGQGALRLAFKQPEIFPVVAAVAPVIEYHELYGRGTALDEMYDSKEQCRQDTAPMHVHPSRYPPHIFFCVDPSDAWHRGSDRLHEKLSALGVPHEMDLTTSAGGHGWDYVNHLAERAVRFVHHGLELESRRLL